MRAKSTRLALSRARNRDPPRRRRTVSNTHHASSDFPCTGGQIRICVSLIMQRRPTGEVPHDWLGRGGGSGGLHKPKVDNKSAHTDTRTLGQSYTA